MKEDFIALQMKRIRRNFLILIIMITLLAIVIAKYPGLGFMMGAILIVAFIMQPKSFVATVKKIKLYSVKKVLSIYGSFDSVAININGEVCRQDTVQYKNIINY